jgi:hypothetical protein
LENDIGVPEGMACVGVGVGVRVGMRVGVCVEVGEGVSVDVAVNVKVTVGVGVLGWKADVILQANPIELTPRKPNSRVRQVFFPAMCIFIGNTSFMILYHNGAWEDAALFCLS